MKRIIIIIASLIIIGVIGYTVFKLFSYHESSGSEDPTTLNPVDLSDNQLISEWREEDRTGSSSETGLLESWPAKNPQLILNTE